MIYVKKPDGSEWVVIETFLGRMRVRKELMEEINMGTLDKMMLDELKKEPPNNAQ